MRLLFKIAGKNRKTYVLLIFSILAMFCLTISNHTEAFTLRVLTEKGADFFELFAHKGSENIDGSISRDDVESGWDAIDKDRDGIIRRKDAQAYISETKKDDLVTRFIRHINKKINLSGNLINLAILVFVVGVLKSTAMFATNYIRQVVAIRVSRDLRQNYFEHIQTLSMSFYQKYHVGNLSSRVMGDATMVADGVNSFLINYFQTPFTLVTTMVLLFATSWKLSMIVFLGLPIIVMPIIFIARRIKRIAKQIQRNQENFASVLLDFLSGIQTVKIFAMEKFSLEKYCEQNDRMALLEKKNARYSLSSRPVLHMIGSFFLASIIIYGIFFARMNISELLFFGILLYGFYEPIKKFAEENAKIQRGSAAADRMFEVLSEKPYIRDHDGAEELKTIEKGIEFDNVWFRYADKWVLKGLSFTINKGDTVALVGPTGAGKSTVALLLPRLYEPQKGEIRIDGKKLSEYTQKSLRETIGFVPQKPFLFYDTVAENIAFGRDFSEEAIEDAARRAHADEFISLLPQRYQTHLEETGKNLSGGQQQRLAIARALVKNAPVLVMDEATSALDAVSENLIKESIAELHGEVTQILIAHRLSTIEHADKIIYIEDGEKIDEGTKDELLESCGNFKRMWEMMMHNKE